ncbi:MAG: PA3496 family putative envelope integrity protein [Gammaproteobacteria bacterium]
MARTSHKSIVNAAPNARSGAEHHDDDELFDDNEFTSLSDDPEKNTIKRDARRKIEIYWEKKRLREQFDDFDESEVDF